jgi:two-component sensor histidine kinase
VGVFIKRILRSRLPERFARRYPPLLVELAIGVLLALLAVGVRYLLSPLIGAVAPYGFVFVAVTIATVLGGWRSGIVSMIASQLLTVYAIIGPVGTFYQDSSQQRVAMIVAIISQLILVTTVALYQREVDRGTAAREKRLSLLDDALREIDHRTRNNYQTVLAMIELQSRRTSEEPVRNALHQVADRIQAIANASQQLAANSHDLDTVRLDDHLCGLVQQIERGLSRKEIKVECDVEDVTASADTATSISIIVNELVTNAIKHAFNGEGSGKVSVMGRKGAGFELIVADDGRGMDATRRNDRTGLGSKLIENFARQLGAKHQVTSSDQGTTHRLVIPRLH